MSKLTKSFIIGGLLMLTMAVPSMAAQHVWRGSHDVVRHSVVIRPHVYYGPAWYPYHFGYWGPRYYWPGYYRPGYYGPGFYGPAYVVPDTGTVKIDTHLRDAVLYVDGGYVGPLKKFKKFDLKPGLYNVEIRDESGQTLFQERVDVLRNKTTEIRLPS